MKRRLFITILVAVLIHLALGQIHILYVPASLVRNSMTNEPIEVDALDLSNAKPIVQSSRTKEEDSQAKDKESKYGAEHRNRVKEEMQAARKGRFQAGQGKPESVPGKDGEEAGAPTIHDLMAYGMSPNEISRDIAIGDQTILNTDPVKYASFINRIADKIYDSWVYYARDAVHSIYLTNRKIEGNVYITRLQIVINREGEVRAIQTLASSGVTELDEAPKRAFWDVEPFNNPPSQLFDKEDLIRFVYEFHFEWKTSSFSIVPPAI